MNLFKEQPQTALQISRFCELIRRRRNLNQTVILRQCRRLSAFSTSTHNFKEQIQHLCRQPDPESSTQLNDFSANNDPFTAGYFLFMFTVHSHTSSVLSSVGHGSVDPKARGC